MFYVHQLVGGAFVPNPDNKPTIDHIDKNKSNNKASNLRWAAVIEKARNRGLQTNNISGT